MAKLSTGVEYLIEQPRKEKIVSETNLIPAPEMDRGKGEKKAVEERKNPIGNEFPNLFLMLVGPPPKGRWLELFNKRKEDCHFRACSAAGWAWASTFGPGKGGNSLHGPFKVALNCNFRNTGRREYEGAGDPKRENGNSFHFVTCCRVGDCTGGVK
ncbi:MAG: hypothetical protein Q8P64_21225 [Deltaproteobacteria bacterium]|nr:hypothetical protein [Deltaproteobacteria bacterium]